MGTPNRIPPPKASSNPLRHVGRWPTIHSFWTFCSISNRAICIDEETISLMCATANVTYAIPTSNNSINLNLVRDNASLAVVILQAAKILAIDVGRLISLIHLFAIISSSFTHFFSFILVTFSNPSCLNLASLCVHIHTASSSFHLQKPTIEIFFQNKMLLSSRLILHFLKN